MGIDFTRPLAWLLLPLLIVLVFVIDGRAGRRRDGLKQRIARAMRIAVISLLVAALSGPALLLPGNQAATWVLADLSASVAGQHSEMEDALTAGLAFADKKLQVGAISFGQSAMVDTPLAEGRTALPLSAASDAGGTDIGHALTMALALLPEDAAGRVALLSDGKDNAGGVAAQIAALSARGIAVDVLPFESGFTRDAQVSSVTPPAQVYMGEAFDVTVRLDATFDTGGTLVLYANRQPVSTREVTLRKGENTFVFQDTAASSGVVTFEAQLIAEGDENPRNNKLGAYMDVRGVPRVLVAGNGDELALMLTAAGMQVDTLLPSQVPQTAEALRQYHCVALVNVASDELTDGTLLALDDYVRKLGRGLAVFGGDNSYALGGWRGSALEDMLPVTMDAQNRLDMPSLGLVLVIDKSGSMSEGRYGVTRLDMATEAAMRSAEVLTARDEVGVVAFDDTAKWVVPMQRVTDVASIQQMIGTIRPGGGTMFYSALAQAFQALVSAETQLKHIIFLTDGEAGDSGYDGIVQRMVENGITLTTVAVGSGANTKILSRLAEWGGGRAYTATEFDDIPKVFTKETYLATQAYAQNRRFYPVIWADGALTDHGGFPSLDGYIVTTAKPLATTALATDEDDPLLAWWQYGAGKAIAWTSDVSGAWTGGFLRWEQASAFFAGIISHVLPAEEGEGELELARDGDQLRLRYMVEEDAQLATEASILMPDGSQARVALSLIAPGVYEGIAQAVQEGSYAVRIEQSLGGSLLRTLESGIAVGYSDEYDLRDTGGLPLLYEIASETGGRVLDSANDLFTERGAQARDRRDISAQMLLIALVLFVIDVAQRRLAWERMAPQRSHSHTAEPPKEPNKKAGNPTRRSKPKAAADKPAVTETAEKLLAGRKKKLL